MQNQGHELSNYFSFSLKAMIAERRCVDIHAMHLKHIHYMYVRTSYICMCMCIVYRYFGYVLYILYNI